MATNPFTFLTQINTGKKDIMVDDDMEKLYNAFIVNRGLSYFYDTALLANEMNIAHHLDNKLQFDFLRTAVRKQKRYTKWNKSNELPKVELLKKYYGYSTAKAEQILPLLSDEQMNRIKNLLSQGGKK